MKKKSSLFLSLVLLILVGSLVIRFMDTSTGAVAQGVPTSVVPTPITYEEDMIADYEAQLLDETISPDLRSSIEGKLAMTQRMLEARSTGVEPLAGPQSVQPPQIQEDPPFQVGIFDGSEGRFHSAEALIENHWQDLLEGKYVQVYAGASASDPQQGLIYRLVTSADRTDTQIDTYITPEKNGSLRIESKAGHFIFLSAQDGSLYSFDINSGELLLRP
jgi:hypothetical protein